MVNFIATDLLYLAKFDRQGTDWMIEHLPECEHKKEAIKAFWTSIDHAQEAMEAREDYKA